MGEHGNPTVMTLPLSLLSVHISYLLEVSLLKLNVPFLQGIGDFCSQDVNAG